MRAFAHASLLAASLLALEAPGWANRGLFLPQSPTGPGGEDTIETSEGTRCRQSINNNGAYADAGVVGNRSRPTDNRTNLSLLGDNSDYAMAYVRVTVPIGAKPKRLDCTQLYDLEINRLKREIELLKLNAE